MVKTKDSSKSKINKDYLDRKQNAVIRDFESAQSWHQETLGRIYGGRGIVITLITAYVGFLLVAKGANTLSQVDVLVTVLPIILIPLPFLWAEINERGHIHYLRSEVIKIENIFMLTDDDEFDDQIQAFVLREIRLSTERTSTNWKRHVILGQHILDAILWYIFVFVVCTISILYFIFR
jgi:hypothetical protein